MSELQKALMHKLYGQDIWAGYTPRNLEPVVQGWHGRHPSLSRLTAMPGRKIVIDIGVWKGESTITMANALKANGIDGVVIAVDTWLGSSEHWTGPFAQFTREHGMPGLYWTFLSNVVRAGLTDYVIPLPHTSTTAAAIFRRFGIFPSVVHVDAAHEYREVLNDAEDYWTILQPGGYLIGDDYTANWPGVVKAADEFARKVGQSLTVEAPKWILRKPAS